MSGWDAFHALTTAGIPLSQSVIVRCTTWLEPDAEPDPDADVDGGEDPLALQAGSARGVAEAAARRPAAAAPPAARAPRFENGLLTFVSSLDRRSGGGLGPYSRG